MSTEESWAQIRAKWAAWAGAPYDEMIQPEEEPVDMLCHKCVILDGWDTAKKSAIVYDGNSWCSDHFKQKYLRSTV